MKVVSNASPLITLARIGHLDSLHKLYERVHIPTEVYDEVVIAGAGMPGAATVSKADWLHVTPVQDTEGLRRQLSGPAWEGERLARFSWPRNWPQI